jgi:glycosyltransferase involved in cell wall biosynthesis
MVLYLGRLHPLKGLEMLVEAWGRLHDAQHQSPQPSMEHWRLVIAGPDEQGTLAALERQSRELGHMESIDFAGPVYGEEKERLLDAADIFVLPTRSENFGIVVAEALAAGVPVITTKGAPWAELLGQDSCDDSVVVRERIKGAGVKGERVKKEVGGGRCGWWVEVGVEPLTEALREAMSLTDEERWAMGENGRRLVEKKYRWEAVAEQMMELYTHIQACTV